MAMDLREYKMMVAVGVAVAGVGGFALHYDAMLPGAVAVITGAIMVLAGLVGALWNAR